MQQMPRLLETYLSTVVISVICQVGGTSVPRVRNYSSVSYRTSHFCLLCVGFSHQFLANIPESSAR